jgi:hypothetical protein
MLIKTMANASQDAYPHYPGCGLNPGSPAQLAMNRFLPLLDTLDTYIWGGGTLILDR